jgi:predicted RNA-binding Zn-ribbon protein involved in translation (DUF1610 family)
MVKDIPISIRKADVTYLLPESGKELRKATRRRDQGVRKSWPYSCPRAGIKQPEVWSCLGTVTQWEE